MPHPDVLIGVVVGILCVGVFLCITMLFTNMLVQSIRTRDGFGIIVSSFFWVFWLLLIYKVVYSLVEGGIA